jgi:uncharacterized membrane protein
MRAKTTFAVAFVVVLGLSGALHFMVTKALIDLLFPGLMVSIFITGAHGGTKAEELMGSLAAFGINTMVYFVVIWAIQWCVSRIRSPK